jgi:hypothetical protein
LKVISVNCKTETIFSTLDFEELVYKYMDLEAMMYFRDIIKDLENGIGDLKEEIDYLERELQELKGEQDVP